MFALLVAGWTASATGAEQYLQVDFEAIYDVTELQFTHTSHGWYTRSLRSAFTVYLRCIDSMVFKKADSFVPLKQKTALHRRSRSL